MAKSTVVFEERILLHNSPVIPYHPGGLRAPLVLQRLPSATLIHLSARMTPSFLHAFWSSSCHTLALRNLPFFFLGLFLTHSLIHDLSSPPF